MTPVAASIPVLEWAANRARLGAAELTARFPQWTEWLAGRSEPTLRQLEEFAQLTGVAIGYFFLPEPPDSEKFPGMRIEPASEILFYQTETGAIGIDVHLQQDTVWLSQDQLAELFQRDKSTISRHIRNVFNEGELTPNSVVADFATTAADGKTYQVTYYNLDMIISVGYRVKSKVATRFRIWATERLREYIVKGFTMDDTRLKELGGGTYWRELLERIRDIRSSEKVLYRQVLDLYATSIDYDPATAQSSQFFSIVQNKLHFAAHGHTAGEVVNERADAQRENMGLTSFAGKRPKKSEIATAKNYLDEGELRRLNTLVSAYFEAAEFRAMSHIPTYMNDWIAHLDGLITAMGAPLLQGAGTVSHKQAVKKAEAEYEKFKAMANEESSDVERAYLASVKQVQKQIEGKKP